MWIPRRFYSQNFEDLYLHRLFSSVDKGFYVDIGASDHSLHSVTACFYEQGWRGINVEPVAESYTTLCHHRPEDTNLNLAVAPSSDSVVEIAVCGDSPGFVGHHRVYTGNSIENPVSYSAGGQAQTRVVDACTLRAVFDRYIGIQSINFLKIDIEGKEFDALESLDLPSLPAHLRPQVILLEVTIPSTQLDAPHRKLCRSLLESNDYKHLFFDGLNDYYCESSLFEIYKPLMLPPSLFDKPCFLPGPGGFGQLFADREEIKSLSSDVERLTEELEKLSIENQDLRSQLSKSLVDAELYLRQLHHVQEELQYYFSLSRSQSELLAASEKLSSKTVGIISSMIH